LAGFKRVFGRKIQDLDCDWLRRCAAAAAGTLIDIGTGEGKFILDSAREQTDWLHIGLDAAAENMMPASRTASTRKTRLDNVVFLRGAAEKLPDQLSGLADRVTIHYPWGSLMRIVAEPDVAAMTGVRKCCKSGAGLTILLNYSVFEDRNYLERLGFGAVADPAASEDLAPAYARAGFRIEQRHVTSGDPSVRTSWGRHLVRGSDRKTLVIEAVATEPESGGLEHNGH